MEGVILKSVLKRPQASRECPDASGSIWILTGDILSCLQ